jgi:hypothetical protein
VRTDLIGGEAIVEHIAGLQEQLTIAQGRRNDAAENLKAAKATDTNAQVEALRAGATAPKATEPRVEAAWNEAERTLTIVSLALAAERQALSQDICSRADAITTDLAQREDALATTIEDALTDIEAALQERADISAHRTWVRNGATGSVGSRRPAASLAVRDLRLAIASQDKAIDREAYLRNYDAWADLVKAAHSGITQAWRDAHSGEEVTAAGDAAIEREVERREEAGEDVPTPTSFKWGQKLGIGKFSGLREEALPVEPDLDSEKARHSDLVKS